MMAGRGMIPAQGSSRTADSTSRREYGVIRGCKKADKLRKGRVTMKYNLDRFIRAQEYDYDQALSEIKAGHKRSHWIWYIFPQVKGLGRSGMSEEYGIDGLDEAKAYMENEVLRIRLIEISQALLQLDSNDPLAVMGFPDNLKLRSSMTLFAEAAPEETVFADVLDKFFDGEKDPETLKRL